MLLLTSLIAPFLAFLECRTALDACVCVCVLLEAENGNMEDFSLSLFFFLAFLPAFSAVFLWLDYCCICSGFLKLVLEDNILL